MILYKNNLFKYISIASVWSEAREMYCGDWEIITFEKIVVEQR